MPIYQIEPDEAKELQDSGDATIIDLRGDEQYSKEHIVGAEHMPSDTLNANNLPDEGKKLIVHCNRGGRATRFCNALMVEDDAVDIYHLKGGIEAWKAAGFAVQKR